MEVHTHTHTPRKKWNHYFWEFIMLFLAVFCGFLAENQREHMIEYRREKVYMTSLVEDLQQDTSWLIRALKLNDYLVKGGDTLRQTIYDVGIKDSAVKKLYVYSRQYLRPLSFQYTDRTSSQLKNSGAMRLIRNKKVADSIVIYDNEVIKEILNQQERENNVRLDIYYTSVGKVLDGYLWNDMVDDKGIISRYTGNPPPLAAIPKDINEFVVKVIYIKTSYRLTNKTIETAITVANGLIALFKREYHLK